jgi:hypothetical protein
MSFGSSIRVVETGWNLSERTIHAVRGQIVRSGRFFVFGRTIHEILRQIVRSNRFSAPSTSPAQQRR